jgi:hypothetical protein
VGRLCAALFVAVALVACTQAPAAVSSPTPEPTLASAVPETPSPSPLPTASPTAEVTVAPGPVQTPEPRPTTRQASEQMLPYYFLTRQQFAVFPSAPHIDFDEPGDFPGDSVYEGLDTAAAPIFAVRIGYVMTPRTAYHEIGHSYFDLLKRHDAATDFLARYWTFRQFPGTWQDSLRESQQQPPSSLGQWMWSPYEIWAEGFSVAMTGTGREKSMDFGHVIDPAATKAFFLSLLPAS